MMWMLADIGHITIFNNEKTPVGIAGFNRLLHYQSRYNSMFVDTEC